MRIPYPLCAFFLATVLLAAALAGPSSMAHAQSERPADFERTLRLLNQSDPLKSPRYQTDRELFDMRILDNNRKLIGRVEDFVIDSQGAIQRIGGDLTRIDSRDRKIYKDYDDVVFHEDVSAFQMPVLLDDNGQLMNDERVDTGQSTARELATIAPAAGGTRHSILTIRGAEMRSTTGQGLGTVTAVLFDDPVTRVEALVLNEVPGAGRYEDIAVPFGSAVAFDTSFGNLQLRLSAPQADTLLSYARNR